MSDLHIEWEPCDDMDNWTWRACDDDDGWELHAGTFGFQICWGSLDVTCDADDVETAKEEAVHMLRALDVWNKAASERGRERRRQKP